MKTFKLDPTGFKQIRKNTLINTIPIILLAALAGLFISYSNQNTGTSIIDTLPFVIPIILGSIGFGLYNGLKRQENLWNSYELTIDNNKITRTQNNVPTVTIVKNDIQEIIESPKGDIFIKTEQKINLIIIPLSIENRDQILKMLTKFGQINKQTKNKNLLIRIVSLLIVPLITIGLMIMFFISKEKYIIIPTGIILTVELLWSFFRIQKNKLIDKKTKKGAYFIFLVLFSIISKLVALVIQ